MHLHRRPRPSRTLPSFPPLPGRCSTAVRAALLSLALASLAGAPARAQTTVPDNQAGTERRAYAVPAGPLGQALNAFAAAAGVELTMDAQLLQDRRSAGLAGSFTVREGFIALLRGHGLQVQREANGSYTLGRSTAPATPPGAAGAVALPEVRVVADAMAQGSAAVAYRSASARAGVLGDMPWLETPYSLEVVPRALIENQQSTSVVEALRNDASVTPTSNAIGGLSSQVAIRGIGLDLLDGRKIDGLNVFSWSGDLPLEHFEEIQLLKGAGGFLYGFGQPGGTLNFISKRPTATPVRSVTLSATDGGTLQAAADLGGRVGQDGRFGYRLNVVGEGGDTYVDQGRIDRQSGSLALDWRLTPDLVWSADVLGMDREVKGSTSWGLLPNASGGLGDYTVATPPAAIRGSRRIYSPFTRYETQARTWGSSLDWRFAPDWNARLTYRGATMDRSYLNGSIYANAAGAYTEEMYAGTDRFKTADVQALVTGRITAGDVVHALAFGVSTNRKRTYYSSVSGYAVLGAGQLGAPGPFDDPGLAAAPADTLGSDIRQRSWFASDTLHLGARWDLVLGLRHSRIEDTPNQYDRSATTPTVAVVFKPAPGLATYASYIESLEAGQVAPVTAANPNQVFPPLKSRQVELGVKVDGEQGSASAALFRIERGLAYTDAANRFSQDGEAHYDGLELSAKTRPTRDWLLGASALFLRARNAETEAALDGRQVQGAPQRQLALYSEYQWPGTAWVLSAGLQHYGARPIDAANTVSLPAYTLFDLGLRYATRLGGTWTTWRLNVDNVANKAYWQTSANYLTQGAPRVVKLSARFDF